MKNLKKKALIALAQTTGMITVLAGNAVYAGEQISAPVGGDLSFTLPGLANLVIQLLFGVAVVLCIIFMVLYGIKYMMAGDDVKAIEGARKGITGAIIGLLIVIFTFAIIKTVASFFLGSDDIWSLIPESWDA